jgi:hypothetical protein
VRELIISSRRSSRLVKSSVSGGTSFPELVVLAGGMVDELGESDTRLSRAGDWAVFVETGLCKQYLNKVGGQGPGPRRRGGAIVEPAPPRQNVTEAKP